MNRKTNIVVVLTVAALVGCGEIQSVTSDIRQVQSAINAGKATLGEIRGLPGAVKDVLPGQTSKETGVVAEASTTPGEGVATVVGKVKEWSKSKLKTATNAEARLQLEAIDSNARSALRTLQVYYNAGGHMGDPDGKLEYYTRLLSAEVDTLTQMMVTFDSRFGQQYPEVAGMVRELKALN